MQNNCSYHCARLDVRAKRNSHRIWTEMKTPLVKRALRAYRPCGLVDEIGSWSESGFFYIRPISSHIGRTHFNLSCKDGAGTLLVGLWSEQSVGNLTVTRHWWDTGRTLVGHFHLNVIGAYPSNGEQWPGGARKVTGHTGHLPVAKQTDLSLVGGWQGDHRCNVGHLVGSPSLI